MTLLRPAGGTARAFTPSHPLNLRSSPALFFNSQVGFVQDDIVPRELLVIGHRVWIGHNATILASVNSIGIGAVIAAGSEVNRRLPPYAVVTRRRCRVVHNRFSDLVIADLLASCCWEHPLEELLREMGSFQHVWEDEPVRGAMTNTTCVGPAARQTGAFRHTRKPSARA